MFEHTRDGDVHRLTMQGGENRMSPDFFAGLEKQLDTVQAESGGSAGLVLTGEGKFFSNGLDLAVMGSLSRDELLAFVTQLMRCMGRLLVFPTPTVAALNGHAFAAGAVLAAACDYRVMREDRGWICLSEIDVGVPIDPALMAVLAAKLPPASLRSALLEGRRFAGPEALAAGWVDALAPEAQLLAHASERAAALAGKGRGIMASLKKSLWGDIARRLGHDPDA